MSFFRLKKRAQKLPTDLDIFNAIYALYYNEFSDFNPAKRQTKIYVPIDIAKIAKILHTDGDIVFGRLYYVHRRKFGYTENDGNESEKVSVPFFDRMVGRERHAIHFPLMAAVLSDLRAENRRYNRTFWISLIALMVSILTLGITLWQKIGSAVSLVARNFFP